jgi:hypothetical protein
MFANTDLFIYYYFFHVKLLRSVLHFRISFLSKIGITGIFQILILYLEFEKIQINKECE